MLDENLKRIFDELLCDFAEKDADIVRSEFAKANLLSAAESQKIKAEVLSYDKFTVLNRENSHTTVMVVYSMHKN